MKPKLINGILLTTAITLWLILVAFHIWQYGVLSVFDHYRVQANTLGYKLTFAGFLLSNTVYLGKFFNRIEKLDVVTLLWRLFITGMGGITVILVMIIIHHLTQDYTLNRYLDPIFFSISVYAFLLFFLSAIFILRRFVLYQRTRRKLIGWNLFMIMLGIALLFTLKEDILSTLYLQYLFPIAFILLNLYISANVRWVAYLNFNQKLKALGLFALILVVITTYVIAAMRFPEELNIELERIPGTTFLSFLFVFPIVYSTFSILVLFFNLPTSSIFELKSLEIASFSKINQAIQSNLDFTDIMNSLLDASVLAANAKVGWLEMLDDETGKIEVHMAKRISVAETQELTQGGELSKKIIEDKQHYLIKNTRIHRLFKNNQSKFRCLLGVPILSGSRSYGVVYIANELSNSFEDVIIQSISTFAEQAGIALENAKLVKHSIEMERYQEQLKIAKEVQTQLLPHHLPDTEDIQFVAMSDNADEVGGDYYDVVPFGEDQFKVAIGDVSGKGTTAAFYMAEIKGIFHALTLMDMDPNAFIMAANQAVSACIQKGFFITLSYLQINLANKEIELVRAGHCPAMYFDSVNDEVKVLREGTMGLGILRHEGYDKLVGEPVRIKYQPGDVCVLYTDGIIEARNLSGEEFGYDRLQEIVERHRKEDAQEIAGSIVQGAREFSQSKLQDDYTVLVIKLL